MTQQLKDALTKTIFPVSSFKVEAMFCRRSQRDGTFFLNSMSFLMLFLASTQASSIWFTNEIPPDNQKVQPGDDVSLSWSFAYSDSAKNPGGPWNAQGVQEISFGIWKPIHGKTFFVKKIVVVDSNGVFQARDEYNNTMDWSRSGNKLTFTLKGFNFQDQATYGINVELGLTQKSLQGTVRVYTGASYMDQSDISTIRNETAYASETVELLFKRSPKDQNDEFSKYRIYKENVAIIKLGGNVSEDGKCVNDSVLLDQCQERFSLSYVNDTYVSFRISNLTLDDSGLYICQTFFLGMHDPEYDEIKLSVKERPSTRTPETATATEAPEITSAPPEAKSGNSDIQFSVTLMSALMIFQALFQP